MKKIKSDIREREKIESGKLKTKTSDGRDITIVCWDADIVEEVSLDGGQIRYPIIAVVKQDIGHNKIRHYDSEGHASFDCHCGIVDDIYLYTEEPELTPFEKKLKAIVNSYNDGGDMTDQGAVFYSKQLLSLVGNKELPKINGWLTRQKNGELSLFWSRPYTEEEIKSVLTPKQYKELEKMLAPDPGCSHKLPKEFFEEIKPEDKPVKVEILFRKAE